MWFWIALVIAVLGLVVVVNSFIVVRFFFTRDHQDETLLIDGKALFGLIRYRYKMPYFIFKGMEEGILVQSEVINRNDNELKAVGQEKINKHKVLEIYYKTRRLITHVFGFTQWLTQTMCHLRCTKLQWKTNVGTGDAAETAVTIGLVWGLKSSLMSVALKYMCFDVKPMLAVNPQYTKAHFSTELACVVKIKLGFAMLSGMMLIYRILRVKGGMKTWQNILFKA
ncbi:MAG TPA: DUF2953 domain-containing protein [Bacilli bacterium]